MEGRVFGEVDEVVCFWNLSWEETNLLMTMDYIDPLEDLTNALEYVVWILRTFATREGGYVGKYTWQGSMHS